MQAAVGVVEANLHHDRSLEHLDEGMRDVPMDGVCPARRVLHGEHQPFLAGQVGQRPGHDLLDVGRRGSLGPRRSEHGASEQGEERASSS